MRGKVTSLRYVPAGSGITPAYAGKSIIALERFTANRDHPRLCGEKAQIRHNLISVLGSPPPMRGKARNPKNKKHGGRITPAYAGKRPLYFSVVGIKRDHPRLCGEKLETRHDFTEKLGSPPPMRGKAWKKQKLKQRFGITPAYAGKRAYFAVEVSSVRDHPRLCGEKSRSHASASIS